LDVSLPTVACPSLKAIHPPSTPPTTTIHPLDSLSTTAAEFARVSGAVLAGFKAIATNFAGVAGQISGPVAIVAKGSEIARTDSAGARLCFLFGGGGRVVGFGCAVAV
jgi:hypothetical protein